MNIVKKKIIACKIEYHWWRIRHLKKGTATTATPTKKQQLHQQIQLHRYEAEQLSYLYDVLCGIRDFNNLLVHPLAKADTKENTMSKIA